MSTTPLLSLPFIMPGQAMKHVTHNEALMRLDGLVHLAIQTRSLQSPPTAPPAGARYLIAADANGPWTGRENQIAIYDGFGWTFLTAQTGWLCWDIAEQLLLVFAASQWVQAAADNAPSQAGQFGVNTVVDSENRLAVKSNRVLLSHDDVTPGTGDIQIVINK